MKRSLFVPAFRAWYTLLYMKLWKRLVFGIVCGLFVGGLFTIAVPRVWGAMFCIGGWCVEGWGSAQKSGVKGGRFCINGEGNCIKKEQVECAEKGGDDDDDGYCGGDDKCPGQQDRRPGYSGCSAVNGDWSGWGGCSASCGGGTQTHSCTDPAPAYGGAWCSGPDSQECNTQGCPVPATVGAWSGCSGCGPKNQEASCTEGNNGGKTCNQFASELGATLSGSTLVRSCNLPACIAIKEGWYCTDKDRCSDNKCAGRTDGYYCGVAAWGICGSGYYAADLYQCIVPPDLSSLIGTPGTPITGIGGGGGSIIDPCVTNPYDSSCVQLPGPTDGCFAGCNP